ncbi:hypothetical protein U9M48_029720 [Paspalum notatum var. saurae]|uniref:Sec20 C-terminal domain-containing protein n=1 Tax=Paspalum notatum var. saurae TaxID=547442 RepID=A0AAQ3U3J8_PASNO
MLPALSLPHPLISRPSCGPRRRSSSSSRRHVPGLDLVGELDLAPRLHRPWPVVATAAATVLRQLLVAAEQHHGASVAGAIEVAGGRSRRSYTNVTESEISQVGLNVRSGHLSTSHSCPGFFTSGRDSILNEFAASGARSGDNREHTPVGTQDIRMDEVTQAVENLKNEWSQAVSQLEESIDAIKSCGKTGKGTEEANYLPRLNGYAQDALQLLKSLQFRLDLLAQQLPTFDEVQAGQATLESWDEQYKKLRASLRNANLQAKENIRKAAQEERELLLGGGEESTIRRRNLQTKAGMTSAAESITESLRRSRQMMVQEVERSASTLATFDESTSVLRKAEGEYQGHRSLLMRTRGLLSTMQRQDVLDRIILTIGFVIFSLAVLYVVSRRIGLLTLQRKLADAIRSGSLSAEDMVAKVQHRPPPANVPNPAPPIYDEL